MDLFNKTVKEIKEIKIQGATNVAFSAVDALVHYSNSLKVKNRKEFTLKLEKAKKTLFETRITEPLMFNCLRYILYMVKISEEKNVNQLKDIISMYGSEARENILSARKVIAEVGEKRIKVGDMILTHCHSSNVIDILKKSKNKKIKVICTETRPLFQGRKTAKELVKAGIPTTLIIDSAVRYYIDEANLVLLGSDAITVEGSVINKIGSSMIASLAKETKIPVYVATPSWKFDPQTTREVEEIEERSPKEVWKNPPKNLKIKNPAFDVISNDLVNLIITEYGVVSPNSLYELMRNKNPWMFI